MDNGKYSLNIYKPVEDVVVNLMIKSHQKSRFISINECKYVTVSAEVLSMHYARNM